MQLIPTHARASPVDERDILAGSLEPSVSPNASRVSFGDAPERPHVVICRRPPQTAHLQTAVQKPTATSAHVATLTCAQHHDIRHPARPARRHRHCDRRDGAHVPRPRAEPRLPLSRRAVLPHGAAHPGGGACGDAEGGPGCGRRVEAHRRCVRAAKHDGQQAVVRSHGGRASGMPQSSPVTLVVHCADETVFTR